MIEDISTLEKRLAASLRARLWESNHGAVRINPIFPDLVSCSAVMFTEWIKQQWDQFQSWDNYGPGRHEWSIDHINSLHNFDMTNEYEIKLAFGYWNCRPLANVLNWSRRKSSQDHVRHIAGGPGNYSSTAAGQLEFINV